MVDKDKISVCIPTYEMHGFGAEYLEHSFRILVTQSYKNFEIVISDQSKDQEIEDCCFKYKDLLDIRYVKYDLIGGSSSANINNAISHSSGGYIKVLFQDDFLYHEDSLSHIISAFEKNLDQKWLVTACEHTSDGHTFNRPYFPSYNHNIHLNMNTISSPSVLSFRKENTLEFDENLKWLMDVDLYKRLHDNFGDPIIINEINVVNRIWSNQFNNTIPEEIKNFELEYVKSKKYLK